MNKKSKAEKMIIVQTTIGCLFSLAGAITFFYFGNQMQQTGVEYAKWVLLAGLFFLLMIPISIFLIYKTYFRR